jgi:hypothetical protein
MEKNNIMKNIHLISTNKPSRLHTYKGVLNLAAGEFAAPTIIKNDLINQNIYITSDEVIKEGNWVLGDYPDNPIGKVIAKYGKEYTVQCLNGNKCGLAQYDAKKIILTTDQNLIKNGVQAIDDTFLKWFVNNPSCEEVEVESWQPYADFDFDYKIIIPQEKAKQECLHQESSFRGYYKDGCYTFWGCNKIVVEEPKQETLENELWGNVFAKIKQYGLNYEVLTVLKQNFNISKR